MASSRLRRAFLWSFLAFLGLTALLAIFAVLRDELGSLEGRVLASSASISAASIAAMACAAYRERGPRPVFGGLGIGLIATALASVLWLIWGDPEPVRSWEKATGVLVVCALATAHIELLSLPRLVRRHRPFQWIALLLVGLLAILLTIMILDEPEARAFERLVAVVAILVTLGTLAVPILWKIGGSPRVAEGEAGERLELRRREDGTWSDPRGIRYRLERLP